MSADSKKPPRSPDAFEISKKYSRVLFSMGAKLLALQREIDELSQPTHPANPLKRETIRNNRPTETKMEEETCEIMKKEKKHKKEKMAPPEVQNSGAEDGSQAKMKKKKRLRQAKMVVKEEQQETEQEEKKKTKRKKHDGINISAVEVETKKKLLEQDVNQAETVTLKVKKLEKKKRKEKKIKDKSLHIEPVHTKKGNKEMQIGDENPPKKPKKKKDNIVFSSEAATKEIVKDKKKKKKLEIADAFVETKAKKKSKLVENGNHVEQETGVKEVKLKKKKKRKTEGFEGELEETEIQRKKKRKIEDPKSSKKIKETFINSEMVAEEEETKAKAKKKKKSIEDDGMAQSEETKTKKRGKKIKVEEEELDQHITLTADPPKKKSKKTAKGNLDINTEAKAGEKKKKKVKKEKEDSQEFPQVDVVFLSAKSGNKDEVVVNQERRKALQMEIDEASQPDKHTGLGQWSTAQFDSSQQQQKFLRLMGGFKKDSQPAGTTSRGANMALGKDAQQQLQQGLLGEFERAQSRRMDFNNRGAGLGFTAPSNKKFSIDINASRSIRFDS